MDFEIDKQTLTDLEVLSDSHSQNSIIGFYNRTFTKGGKNSLIDLIQTPISDMGALNQRVDLIHYLSENPLDLKIRSTQLDSIDYYLNLNTQLLRGNRVDAWLQKMSYKIKPTNSYYLKDTGIRQLLFLIKALKEITTNLKDKEIPDMLSGILDQIDGFIRIGEQKELFTYQKIVGIYRLNKLDRFFRKHHKNELTKLIENVYLLDAFSSLSIVYRDKKLTLPKFNDSKKPEFKIEGLYHPLLENPVSYDIDMINDTNLCFLTGPNMAGKSTFLKSIGLSVYLSHAGFPIPAKSINLSVYRGLISTINLADNINAGYSHFYGEVRRVKEAALLIKKQKRLFVIFDELFKGTNVKDAFDASTLVIKSFAKISSSSFFISTHITEVAEELKDFPNIKFNYFDSKIVDNKPVYNYQLEEGVSHERLGMYIIHNEQIPEILDSIGEEDSTLAG